MRVHHREDELEGHDRGLDHDLPRLLQRRGMLKLVAGASLVTLVGCATTEETTSAQSASPATGSSPTTSGSASSSSSRPSGSPADGTPSGAPPGGPPPREGEGSDREVSEGEIPEETAGTYPGDGSNGANVLTETGVVRSDITTSFGSSTTKAEGVPLTITMTLQNYDKDGAATPVPRSTCGTATAKASTRCTPRPSRTRTTCGASRRPTRRAR